MPAFIFYEHFSDRNRSIFAGFMALIQMKVCHEIESILYTEYDPANKPHHRTFKAKRIRYPEGQQRAYITLKTCKAGCSFRLLRVYQILKSIT